MFTTIIILAVATLALTVKVRRDNRRTAASIADATARLMADQAWRLAQK